jgi:hypothetical protein
VIADVFRFMIPALLKKYVPSDAALHIFDQ